MLNLVLGRAFHPRRPASSANRALAFLFSLAAVPLSACGDPADDAASARPTSPSTALAEEAPAVSEPAVNTDAGADLPAASDGALKGCTFEGRSFAVGDTFHDALWCNSCSCTATGAVCTARACDPAAACTQGDRKFAAGTTVVCEDGCNRCQCVDRGWTTTLALCTALPKVERCADGPARGVARSEVLYRKGDALALSIGTGGCQNEVPPVKLCWDGAMAESLPVQMRLRVEPTAVTSCSGWVTQEKVFDLTPLKEAFRAAYPGADGAVRVLVGNDSVTYAF
ncbi:MAG: hypothetical protein ABW252_19045 [Polyangiales bacterium]